MNEATKTTNKDIEPEIEKVSAEEFLNQKLAEAQEAETASLFQDFDAMYAEWKNAQLPPHQFKFLDKTFDVSRSMPSDFTVLYLRHCIKPIEGGWKFEVPEELFFDFLRCMFGEEFIDHVGKHRVEMSFLFDRVVPQVLAFWGIEWKDTGDLSGKVEPVEIHEESSGVGEVSKPTSNDSTD